MKNLINLCLFAIVILTACNTTNDPNLELYPENQSTSSLPANPANPYDYIGIQHLRSTDQRISIFTKKHLSVAQSNKIQGKRNDYTVSSHTYNFESSEVTLLDLINDSQLTMAAQEVLLDFISNVLDINEESYITLYNYIVAYEDAIIASNVYSSEDRRIILSFTSIVRYAAYQNNLIQTQSEGDDDEEIEDEDWNISVGNMIGWLSDILNDSNSSV